MNENKENRKEEKRKRKGEDNKQNPRYVIIFIMQTSLVHSV